MDETKQAGADTSRNEDSLQGKTGSTSNQEPKLIPETEIETRVQKLVSDRLAQAGREAKSLEATKAELAKREQEIADWQAKKDEDERKAIEGNPELLDVYQQKKKLRDEQAAHKKERLEFEKEKLEHQIEIESAREVKKEIDIFDITQEYEGGDAMKLKTLCELSKVTAKDDIRKVADTIWTKKQTSSSQADATKQKRDSGMTIGGTGEKTYEQSLKERYPSMQK